jgi:hypothetical protein
MNDQGWKIEEHRDAVRKLFKELLDPRDHADAAALLEWLRIRGNQLREPQSKSLGEGLFELRGKQVRIFYVFRPGRRAVVLGGMVKKQTEIPPDLLNRMRALAKEVASVDKSHGKKKS